VEEHKKSNTVNYKSRKSMNKIIQRILDIVTILPLTSLKKNRRVYPNEVLLKDELEKPSLVLCQQIRTISKQEIGQTDHQHRESF